MLLICNRKLIEYLPYTRSTTFTYKLMKDIQPVNLCWRWVQLHSRESNSVWLAAILISVWQHSCLSCAGALILSGEHVIIYFPPHCNKSHIVQLNQHCYMSHWTYVQYRSLTSKGSISPGHFSLWGIFSSGVWHSLKHRYPQSPTSQSSYTSNDLQVCLWEKHITYLRVTLGRPVIEIVVALVWTTRHTCTHSINLHTYDLCSWPRTCCLFISCDTASTLQFSLAFAIAVSVCICMVVVLGC